jgi:DNA polymerase I
MAWYATDKQTGKRVKVPQKHINNWEPTLWNFKRDERGKPARNDRGEIINTTPKLQEQGKICPNLLELNGDLPKRIVRFLSLRNRASVITGWLNHWRLEFDGRLPAEITGYTPTFRVKHSCIVNLPKASPEVIKGYEVRSLFVSSPGMKYVSADAAALEQRTVSDFTYKFDDGKFADLVLNGDSHSFNACVFFPKETAEFDITSRDFNKDHPGFKPYRNKAKSGAYSLAYGASVKKFTKTLGLTEREGNTAYENYWEANKGLKLFKESVEKEWQHVGDKKYIRGKDGKLLTARSKHLLVNLSGQSLGATVITYALCIMDNKLGWMDIDDLGRPFYNYKGYVVKRLAAFHDQGDYECNPEIADEVGQMIVQGIVKAGELLGMRVATDGEYKVGNNAAEIH